MIQLGKVCSIQTDSLAFTSVVEEKENRRNKGLANIAYDQCLFPVSYLDAFYALPCRHNWQSCRQVINNLVLDARSSYYWCNRYVCSSEYLF